MLNISLLTIGDEICIGQIVNTNAARISDQLTGIGVQVLVHSTIRDDKDMMMAEIHRLLKFSDILIITGGLGPTHDDITKTTLLDYFNDHLETHEPTLKYLKDFFAKRGYELTERNRSQADLPSKCKPLENRVGTAPGMMFEKDGKYVYSLPGVPNEMEYIVNNSVLPFIDEILKKQNHNVVLYKMLYTAGIPESILAEKIGDPKEFIETGSLAFLPSYHGVRLRLGIEADNIEDGRKMLDNLENKLKEKAGKYIIGEGDEDLAFSTAKMLKENKKTVSVAESCTGGLLGGAFTDIAGSSEYFEGGIITYSNEAKIEILGVDRETIVDHGAVSEQTAKEMAKCVREKFGTDYGISITGIAGPEGGTKDKPVGTVWLGLADGNGSISKRYVFGEDRDMNRQRSVGTALNMLLKKLKGLEI